MGPHQLLAALVVVLIIVLIWRGPKTLPLIGRAFGQGVKEARKEIDGIRQDAAGKDAAGKDDTVA
jgi:Sec-independent protein translocase protein TatA